MSLNETVIEGTLKPDGTLELDERPSLPPGRVQVIVQPLSTAAAPAKRGLVEEMDDVRVGQRARGYQGRTVEAMHAEEQLTREENAEYDRRCESQWGGPLPPPANSK